MAVCAWCQREMTTGASCVEAALHLRGQHFDLVPFGDEQGGFRSQAARCGDCGVARGGLHHPGCDLQGCPRCGRQLISCGCRFDEHASEHDDEDEDEDEDDWDDWDDWDDEDDWADDRHESPPNPVSVVIVPNESVVREIIERAALMEAERLRSTIIVGLAQRRFTIDQIWACLGRPEFEVHVGAELVRILLRPMP